MIKNLTLVLAAILFSFSLHADHLSDILQLTARMNGANEVPAVMTDAQGVGVFTLNDRKNAINIDVSVAGLSGAITGIHLHEGAPGTNGGVVYNLTPFVNGNRVKTVLKNLTPADVQKFLSGAFYLNVHTAANPNGEIRGQVILETDSRYFASLDGSQEVPAVTTDAFGLGVFNLSKSGYKLQIKAVVTGLSGPITGAHLHNAAFGVNGGVVENLTTFVNGNVITATVDPAGYIDELRAGNIYLNIHTDANPAGEIRGQVLIDEALYFDAFLDGAQEVPAVMTTAEGVASISVSNDLSQLVYDIVVDGLSGPITGAHLHTGGPGVAGGVIVNLSDAINGNRISGTAPMNPALLNMMLRGGIYINIHTAANPAGEIRGQVYKLAREAYSFEFSGGQEVPPVMSPATGAGMVTIDRDQSNAHFMMVISGLSSDFAAAHFHNGRPGTNGGVIFNLTPFFNEQGGAYGYWTENDATPFANSPMFRTNQVYVNVHTANFPSGEIRANSTRSRDFFVNLPVDPRFGADLLIASKLTGDQEVPAVTTNAVGVTSFLINENRDEITVNVSVNGLSGPITGIHVHEGAAGTNGGVVFNLTPFVVGNRVKTTLTEFTEEQLATFLSGGYYLNVHTAANPNGEIRGQLILETDPTYRADIDGMQEVPAVMTDARGLATFNYTNVVNSLEVNVLVSGLSGPITGAHLHNAAMGMNGGVVEDLTSFIRGNRIQGVVFPAGYLDALKAGEIYINIHTDANPNGEIRGQLMLDKNLTFDSWLSGAQEVPTATTAATGFAAVSLSPDFSMLSVRSLVNGLSGEITGAHFHTGALGEAGGVVLNLSDGISGNEISFEAMDAMVTDALVSDLLRGNIYLNVHTAGFPGGEVRGQMYRLARDGYGYDLCTQQETGTVNAPTATGAGMASIDRHQRNAHVMIVVSGLTGDLTGAHIHEGEMGMDGGVVVNLTDLFNNGGAFTYLSGDDFNRAISTTMKDGNNYVNIHTAAHPAGEIRGQIVKDLTCELTTSSSEREIVFEQLNLSPVPASDMLNVRFAAKAPAKAQVKVLDLTGRQVFSNTYQTNVDENFIQLDVRNYVPGFYTVIISDGSNVLSGKFIR